MDWRRSSSHRHWHRQFHHRRIPLAAHHSVRRCCCCCCFVIRFHDLASSASGWATMTSTMTSTMPIAATTAPSVTMPASPSTHFRFALWSLNSCNSNIQILKIETRTCREKYANAAVAYAVDFDVGFDSNQLACHHQSHYGSSFFFFDFWGFLNFGFFFKGSSFIVWIARYSLLLLSLLLLLFKEETNSRLKKRHRLGCEHRRRWIVVNIKRRQCWKVPDCNLGK